MGQILPNIYTARMKGGDAQYVYFTIRQINKWGKWQKVPCYFTGRKRVDFALDSVLRPDNWVFIVGDLINKIKPSEKGKYLIDVEKIYCLLRGDILKELLKSIGDTRERKKWPEPKTKEQRIWEEKPLP